MSDLVPVNEFLERSDNTLRAAILHADTLRQELAERKDWEQLAFAIKGLRAIKGDLDTLLRECENDVARLMPEKKVVVDGIGQLERRTTITRRWESAELLEQLCRVSLTDKETGEVPMDLLSRIVAILSASLPIVPSTGWRVTAIKEMGIDPDAYCEKTYGRQTIQFTN